VAAWRPSDRFDGAWVDISVSRVGPTSELDGEGGVEPACASVEIVSVTALRFSAIRFRRRACRTRFEATPFGVRA
jgi:hypothetical protein